MFIISRLCFPKWRHWCPGVAWVSQRFVVVAVWSSDLNEVIFSVPEDERDRFLQRKKAHEFIADCPSAHSGMWYSSVSAVRISHATQTLNSLPDRGVLCQIFQIAFDTSILLSQDIYSFTITLNIYRGADKSLALPRRKPATATEDFDVHISYL